MRFLEVNEIWDWCHQHHIELAEKRQLASDPRFSSRGKIYFTEGQPSGREPVVARAAVAALGDWHQCLLWVTQVGVWPSSEDWPAYYSLRGARGERRSIEVAPGHLFYSSEDAPLFEFLTVAMTSGWDAHVLPVRTALPADRRLFVSHDEFVEVFSLEPLELHVAAV